MFPTLTPPDASSDDLVHVLERYWGYTSFRPLQREAMTAVVEGRDSLLVLPTGGGKSLCYQLPAAIMPRGISVASLLAMPTEIPDPHTTPSEPKPQVLPPQPSIPDPKMPPPGPRHPQGPDPRDPPAPDPRDPPAPDPHDSEPTLPE